MNKNQSAPQYLPPTVLGIDIGGTNTVFGIVTAAGNILVSGTLPTRDFATAEYLFAAIQSQLKTWDETLVRTVKGVGVGVPNGNYYSGEVLDPPNLPWSNVNLVKVVADSLSLPGVITNDANAAALGEMLFGAARGLHDFIEITLGTGLGSGLVVAGNIVYGHDGLAGELGHLTVEPNGRLCGCGRKGCLETYVSAPGLVRTANELGFSFGDKPVTSQDIYFAARQGNDIAREAFRVTGEILGRSMANIVAVLSPETIILFGGMARAGDLLLQPAQRTLDHCVMSAFRGKTKFILSQLSDTSAAVLGAAALFFKENTTAE